MTKKNKEVAYFLDQSFGPQEFGKGRGTHK